MNAVVTNQAPVSYTHLDVYKRQQLRDYAIRVSQGQKVTPPNSSNDELAELALAMQTMRVELDGKQHVQDSIQHLTHELKSCLLYTSRCV